MPTRSTHEFCDCLDTLFDEYSNRITAAELIGSAVLVTLQWALTAVDLPTEDGTDQEPGDEWKGEE